MTTTRSTSAPPGRALRHRDLTPDVTRGLALLGIAVVNAALLAPHAVTSTSDRLAAVLVTALLENRSWPAFALLFGFGIAAIAARLDDEGLDRRDRDRVLRRRNWWLLGFGLAQVLVVFWADILGVYALTGMVVVALLHRSTRTRVVLGVLGATAWLVATVALAAGGTSDEVPGSTSYLASVGERLEVFVVWTGANSLLLTHLAPMLVGVALHELGALHRPAQHLRLHRRLALGGLVVGLLGATPLCLDVAGLTTLPTSLHAGALGLHAVSGLAQGIAYVSLVAVWSAGRPLGTPLRGPVVVLVATGRRSLTAYLLHSVLLGLALSPWALDLAGQLTVTSTYAVGLGVWAACAALATALEAARRPGPADLLLRRLTYGARDER